MAGFDYGSLARASAVWCSDEACDSGGWSDPRTLEEQNCPGYGGNKAKTYTPSLSCNGVPDVPAFYNGGFGAPVGFRGANFGAGGATSSAIPAYARVQ